MFFSRKRGKPHGYERPVFDSPVFKDTAGTFVVTPFEVLNSYKRYIGFSALLFCCIVAFYF